MNGTITKTPVTVITDGEGGPIIIVSLTQLGAVRAVLARLQVKHTTDEKAAGVKGLAVVTLAPTADAGRVQEELDKAE